MNRKVAGLLIIRRDKSEAVRQYARQAKNRNLEADAGEIRLRAERKLGELLREGPKATGAMGVGPIAVPERNRNATPTLADQGLDKKLSARAQKMAAVPQAEFEGRLATFRHNVIEEGKRASMDLVRADLTPAELAIHIGRRKLLYELLHPETKRGGAL